MINIDKELIFKELNIDTENGYIYTHKKLSNRFLDWLFNKYYVVEMCENYYDSEPHFDDEMFAMYMDYEENPIQIKGLTFWNMLTSVDEM